MRNFVLDTNVISELVRLKPEPKMLSFLEACDELIVSAVVFNEFAYGPERIRDELAGRLRARASRSGWALAEMDSMFAATAVEKGAQLATRNIDDFERLRIPLINTWSDE